jgi:hypothetical protein
MSSVLVHFAAAALLLALPFFLQPPPAFAQAAGNANPVMLESTSDQGTFLVKIEWTPADISTDNTFKIRFIEPETGRELEDVAYDFIIVSSASGQEVVHRHSQTSEAAAAASTQTVEFSAQGPYTIKIANIDGLGEGANFDVTVTPEFAPAMIILAAAAGIALVSTIFRARFQKGL